MTILTLQKLFRIYFLMFFFLSITITVYGQGWPTPTIIDGNTQGGHYSQELLEVNGRPAVAHYDPANYRLVYKRASNSTGGSWPASSTIVDTDWRSGNNSIDMEIVNGNPAIVSDSPVGKDVRYTRADNANGTSWGTTVLAASNIAASYGGDLYLDLEVVNGNPAVAYFDGDNEDLYFVRANDANGTTWGTPVLIESSGDVGEHLSMEVVSGRPAISFYKSDTKDLVYIRASDASGTTWGSPVTVVSVDDVGKHSRMKMMNGAPAIVYYNATQKKVMYTRATTSTGSMWSDGEYNTGNGSASDLELLEVEGRPAIAYRAVVDGNPKFLISDSQHGLAWDLSKTVIIDGSNQQTGNELSLAMINGYPAVAHRNLTNNDLVYARSLNTNGLPVELTFFKGKSEQNSNRLEWQTASEENNEGFNVERSLNGEDWERIGFVAGNGTSTNLQNYIFIDEKPFGSTLYYRLKQVDFDGDSEYSDIIFIKREKETFPIDLVQNPVREAIRLNIHEDIETQVSLMDVSGKMIKQLIFKNQGTEHINIQNLPSGTYLLNIRVASQMKTLKIIKE